MRFFILLILLFTGSLYSQSDYLYEKSISYFDNNKIDSAAYFYRKAYKINPSSNSKFVVTYSKILKILGKPDSSYFYLDKAEYEIKKRNFPDSILLIYALKAELSRSTVSKSLNDRTISDADLFFNRNKDIFANTDIVAYYLNRKMASFNAFHSINKDTLKLIFDISDTILNLDSKIKNKEIVAYTLNEIAQVYEYRVNTEGSREYYEKANEYSASNHLSSSLIDNSINYARFIQIKEIDLKGAIDLLQNIEKQVDVEKDVFQALTFYEYISDLYAAYGDFENAHDYYKKAAAKKLEIERNKNNLYIKDLEIENKIRIKQNELNLNKQKLEDVDTTTFLLNSFFGFNRCFSFSFLQ